MDKGPSTTQLLSHYMLEYIIKCTANYHHSLLEHSFLIHDMYMCGMYVYGNSLFVNLLFNCILMPHPIPDKHYLSLLPRPSTHPAENKGAGGRTGVRL